MEEDYAASQPEVSQGVTEGVPTESAPVELDSPTKATPPGENYVPHTRFNEVNEAKKSAERRAHELERQLLELNQRQARPEHTVMAEPVIDRETDEAVAKILERRMEQDPRFKRMKQLEDEVVSTRTQVQMQNFRSNIPGFADHEDAVLEKYGKLREENFMGEGMVKLIMSALAAEDGSLVKQGMTQAQQAQTMRMAAAGPPSGGASGAKEAPKSPSEMTLQERDEWRRGNLHASRLRPD